MNRLLVVNPSPSTIKTKHLQQLAILLVGVLLFYFAGLRNMLLYTIGLGIGVLFVFGSIGFTSAWRTLITKGNPFPFYGQIIMLFLGIMIIMPVFNFFPTLNKMVAPLTYSSFVGAFLFGMGMQLGDGCGSGTLVKLGYNQFSRISIFPFIIGSFIGTMHIKQLMSYGGLSTVPIDFAKILPLPSAMLVQLTILFIVAMLAWRWSKYKQNRVNIIVRFSWQEYRKLYLSMTGVVLLALCYTLLSGRGWGISFGLGLWGAKIANWIGFDVWSIPYWTDEARSIAISQSVIFDTTSLSNFGLILGAWYTTTQKKKSPINCRSRRNIFGAVLGGLLMGYGAQLAFGCNIGPFFSGISSGSAHGWTWFLFALLGTIVAIPLRRVLIYND